MKALTLWRPWPYAIFHLPPHVAKRVENRSWKPPATLIGRRIAIHAGRDWDDNGEDAVVAALERHDLLRGVIELRSEGIIGTAVLCGVVEASQYTTWDARRPCLSLIAGRWPAADGPANIAATVQEWFLGGHYGWLLDDVRPLPKPIPCKGRQGLWDVPAELVGRLP